MRLECDGETYVLDDDPPTSHGLHSVYRDRKVIVFEAGEAYVFADVVAASAAITAFADGALRSPMPGKIAAVHVAVGDVVDRGAALVTLEAMKMEHALTAPFDGVVAEVAVRQGDQVGEGVMLVRVEKAA